MAASASADLSVKLWDFGKPSDVKCVKTLIGHDHSVTGLVFLKPTIDGAQLTLASASRDNTIKLWDLETGWVTLCLRTSLS